MIIHSEHQRSTGDHSAAVLRMLERIEAKVDAHPITENLGYTITAGAYAGVQPLLLRHRAVLSLIEVAFLLGESVAKVRTLVRGSHPRLRAMGRRGENARVSWPDLITYIAKESKGDKRAYELAYFPDWARLRIQNGPELL